MCGATGIFIHCWWECKMVQPLWKTVCWFLTKLDILLSCDLEIMLLGIYPKELQKRPSKNLYTMFITAL